MPSAPRLLLALPSVPQLAELKKLGRSLFYPVLANAEIWIYGLTLCGYTESTMTVIVKSKSPLTVPDQVRRRAGFKPGDHVEFKVSRGVVTIQPKRSASCSPDDVLTEAEAKKVRHALGQVREGKTVPWSRVKDELGL